MRAGLIAWALLLVAVRGAFAHFRVLTGEEAAELELAHSPQNLELAARTGDTVYIDFTEPLIAATFQEDATLILSCFPWLQQFPGGTIQWFLTLIDEYGDLIGTETLQRFPGGVFPPRRIVTGEFDQFVEITRTLIVPGGEDADTGIYECQVCTDRGTAREVCNSSSATLLGIGSPPDINDTDSDCKF